MSVGTNIRYYRKLNGMSQQELADKLGITNKAVSSWEKDRTEPNMGFVNRMCEIFNCSASNISNRISALDMGERDALIIQKLHLLSERDRQVIEDMIDTLLKKAD